MYYPDSLHIWWRCVHLYFSLLFCISIRYWIALSKYLLYLPCSQIYWFNLLVCDITFFDQVWLPLINKSAANFSSTLYASFADHHNFLMILALFHGKTHILTNDKLWTYADCHEPSRVVSTHWILSMYFDCKVWISVIYPCIWDSRLDPLT